MKYSKTLAILMFSLTIIFYSCKEETTAAPAKKEEPKPFVPITGNGTNSTGSAFHYTCSNGCAGGAASATNCTTCGTLLVHNQAFHANNAQTNNPVNTSQPVESGRNAAGVWHYTCEQGCTGGAGSAGLCSTCGSKLAHNQAYH